MYCYFWLLQAKRPVDVEDFSDSLLYSPFVPYKPFARPIKRDNEYVRIKKTTKTPPVVDFI